MAEDNNETYSIGKDEDSELTRREMIKLGASAAIAAALTGLDANAFARAVQDKTPLFFTKEEFALVDELTELIIPTDEHSPGARAAQVASYLDFRLSESFEEEPKTVWRQGLKLIEKDEDLHPILQIGLGESDEVVVRVLSARPGLEPVLRTLAALTPALTVNGPSARPSTN